jgi:hypothetical protein
MKPLHPLIAEACGGRNFLLHYEDPQDFVELFNRLEKEFQPSNSFLRHLVLEMAVIRWFSLRTAAMIAGIERLQTLRQEEIDLTDGSKFSKHALAGMVVQRMLGGAPTGTDKLVLKKRRHEREYKRSLELYQTCRGNHVLFPSEAPQTSATA